MDRRTFVKQAAMAGAMVPFRSKADSSGMGGDSSSEAAPAQSMLRIEDTLDTERMKPRGQFVDAIVPDTLDLAERARFSVNNLTHNVDPDRSYYLYQTINFGPNSDGPDPKSLTWDITPKNARALPWMRTMCGSTAGIEHEYGMLKAMMSQVRGDGLMYFPVDGFNPKGTAYPDTNGVLILACENHYGLDGNPQWLEWVRLIASGLKRVAIRVENRAYYPPECTVYPNGKWAWNLRGIAKIPYDPPAEPYLEEQGLEGCVKFEQAYAMRGLVRALKYDDDDAAKDLLELFTNFYLKPGLWENTTLNGYEGNEHGVFAGHFHGNSAALLALLDVGEIQGNSWLKQFVREAYDNAVRNGAARMGWYPGWIMPEKYARDSFLDGLTEGDGPGEMIELGVRLTDAGLGEYWDDVDALVRNQLTEQQFCDLALMQKMAAGAPIANQLDNLVGGFGIASPTATKAEMYGCCSANGSIGLYYAWEGITRFDNGIATVNLLLNRASKWMDVHSYLPYEGKVELYNKQAKLALVRIPSWVDKGKVRAFLNDMSIAPVYSGRYLVVSELRPGAVIRLEFSNPQATDSYMIAGMEYHATYRGSTIVDIQPRTVQPALRDWYGDIRIPIYQRDDFKRSKAPVHKVSWFVPEKTLRLQ